MALAAEAAKTLQDGSGIESETIALRLLQLKWGADFVRHLKRQFINFVKLKPTYLYKGRQFTLDRKTIVVVDEAGMVGTRQLAELIDYAKSRSESRAGRR